jgi:hypothetical protein
VICTRLRKQPVRQYAVVLLARAGIGDTTAAPPGSVMNSRRFISLPVSLAEIKPPLLNRDGKTADQPCDRFQILGVLVLEESGEPLNTFVVAVQKRSVIDWSFGL